MNQIESLIAKEEYTTLGVNTTACVLTLKSGFEIVGTAACVKPEEYDLEIGKKCSRERAITKLWEVVGYHAQAEGKTVAEVC